MRAAAGVVLGQRYRLVREIAVGGMGEVWVAHDESLARDVAIKVLREEFAGDPNFLSRFRTEARNSAALSHQNIAQLYDYGEQEGSAFLVIELVLGEPMSDLLEREPVLPPRKLLPILAQTARALHHAHDAGVVHRDVKPGNILLGRGGRVKITDFGVSLATNQVPMTATGMVMGTAQYLSPEQAVGQPATPHSDLYSLGIVAYEALAGKRPFTGPTAVDIAVAHVNAPVPPLPAAIDKRLAGIVLSLLAKDPRDRPPSAAQLARILDEMVERTPATGVAVVVPARRSSGRGGTTMIAPGADVRVVPPTQQPGPRRAAPPPAAAKPAAAKPAVAKSPAAPASIPPAPHGHPADDDGHPPSYPPRRELRDATEVRRTAGTHRAPTRAGWITSTTTGNRLGKLGRLTWPLVALVLLVVALLGAALADRLTGAEGGSPPGEPALGATGTTRTITTTVPRAPATGTDADAGTPTAAVRPGYALRDGLDGMITERARVADRAAGTWTTTAKDA
ncbi:serine/threonine-protein kinase [Cellulomonas cellasea]|uniref:serine/threonine-protein kinase n=1 Tax=Cellulomonas cellasea TaxID=43670 RepID=UPI001141DCCC|nr:serine/threonine-protein kinase [Cellulomonas cellasea]